MRTAGDSLSLQLRVPVQWDPKPEKAPQIPSLGCGAPLTSISLLGCSLPCAPPPVLRVLSSRRRARSGSHLHRVEAHLRFEGKFQGKFFGTRGNPSPGTGVRAAPWCPQRVARISAPGCRPLARGALRRHRLHNFARPKSSPGPCRLPANRFLLVRCSFPKLRRTEVLVNTCISAIQTLRLLRGSAQAHLLKASDGALPRDERPAASSARDPSVRERRRQATNLGLALGLPMPGVEVIEVSDWLIEHTEGPPNLVWVAPRFRAGVASN